MAKKSDPAHIATDAEIAKIEKLITKEYKKAHKQITEKCEDYFARFAAKDAKWQEWVKAGTKTEKEYKEWRKGQMMVGKRWEDLRDTLAEDYTNAAKIAQSIAKGHAPEVYAINHNYATFEVEKGSLLDTSYTLYSRESVEYMYKGKPKLYHTYGKAVAKEIKEGKQHAWDRRRITSVLTQAILQGESIPNITKRLEAVTAGDHKAAIRNARTMMTGVQNAGRVDAYNRARDMGIPVQKQWMATLDMRTRHWHRQLDGVIVDIDKPFNNEFGDIMFPGDPEANAANVYNCFIGETKVASDSEIVRSYKHDYTGRLITIETAGGVKFTCTPNHPILTPRGWVGAERLKCGNNILIASVGENNSLRIDPNVNHTFARFDAIHELFNKTRGERTRSLSVNFHGDIPTTDVEIVTKERFLRSDGNTRVRDSINKLLLIHPDESLMSEGTLVKHFVAITQSALSLMSSRCKTLALILRGMSHAIIHRFRTIAGCDSVVFESQTNDMPRHAKFIGNGLNGATTVVLTDNIVDIKISSVRHIPVYNLQTVNGYYFVNNIIPQSKEKYNCKGAIAHNCRCTLMAAIKGFEIDTKNTDLRHDANLGGMSYDEWLKSKKSVSNPIDLPEKKAAAIKGAWYGKYGKGSKIGGSGSSGGSEAAAIKGAWNKEYSGEKASKGSDVAWRLTDSSYRSVETVAEAEQYAKDAFVEGGGFNLTGKAVSFKGVDIDTANRINQRLTSIYEQFDITKLSSLESFGKVNKKVFSKHADAPFITTNFGNIGINSTIVKNAKELEKYNERGRKSFQYVMDNMDKLTGEQKQIALAYQKAGKSLVGDSLEDMITHEIGHHISYMPKVNSRLGEIQKSTDWKKTAEELSGYANHSFGEYVAESFNAYCRGERDKLQPELIQLFDSLRR